MRLKCSTDSAICPVIISFVRVSPLGNLRLGVLCFANHQRELVFRSGGQWARAIGRSIARKQFITRADRRRASATISGADGTDTATADCPDKNDEATCVPSAVHPAMRHDNSPLFRRIVWPAITALSRELYSDRDIVFFEEKLKQRCRVTLRGDIFEFREFFFLATVARR